MANLRPNLDAAIMDTLNVASLLTLATGGVYNSVAPQETEPPYVVFQAMSEVDDDYSFSGRGEDAVYMAKAISRSPWPKEANTINTQINALLQDATLSITGYAQLLCRRTEAVFMDEDLGGDTYTHIGGMYRITADES